jgi:hypothetical protein
MRLAPLPAAPWQKATCREDCEAAGRLGADRTTMVALVDALEGQGAGASKRCGCGRVGSARHSSVPANVTSIMVAEHRDKSFRVSDRLGIPTR